MKTKYVNEARAILSNAALRPVGSFAHVVPLEKVRKAMIERLKRHKMIEKNHDGEYVTTKKGLEYLRGNRPAYEGATAAPRTFVPVGLYHGMDSSYARAGASDALRVRSLSPFTGGF